jgi:hypothetical protein
MAIIREMRRAGRSQVANDSLHGRRKLLLAVFVWSVLAVASTNAVAAGDEASSSVPPTHRSGIFSPQELSFRFAYGMGDKESLNFYTFGPRVAYDLPDFVPAILGNRIRLAIEMYGSIINGHNHPLDGEFAFSPLILNYRYDTGGSFVPFIEGGEGIVLTTLDELNIGGPFEFSSQGGGGIQWFFSRKYALTIDARYRHISNGGIKEQNSGLNTLFIGVSLGHFPDRQ